MLDTVQSLVMTAVAVTGVVVAIVGLKTWRRQLRGGTQYEVARRLLRAVYAVRDEVAYVRGPFTPVSEIAAAIKEAGLETEELEIGDRRAIAAARALRWKGLTEAWSNLQAEALEAEVLWGGEVRECLNRLGECVKRLQFAFIEHAEFWEEAPREQAERQRFVEVRRVLHGSGGETDQFWAEVQATVGSTEEFLRSHLELS